MKVILICVLFFLIGLSVHGLPVELRQVQVPEEEPQSFQETDFPENQPELQESLDIPVELYPELFQEQEALEEHPEVVHELDVPDELSDEIEALKEPFELDQEPEVPDEQFQFLPEEPELIEEPEPEISEEQSEFFQELEEQPELTEEQVAVEERPEVFQEPEIPEEQSEFFHELEEQPELTEEQVALEELPEVFQEPEFSEQSEFFHELEEQSDLTEEQVALEELPEVFQEPEEQSEFFRELEEQPDFREEPVDLEATVIYLELPEEITDGTGVVATAQFPYPVHYNTRYSLDMMVPDVPVNQYTYTWQPEMDIYNPWGPVYNNQEDEESIIVDVIPEYVEEPIYAPPFTPEVFGSPQELQLQQLAVTEEEEYEPESFYLIEKCLRHENQLMPICNDLFEELAKNEVHENLVTSSRDEHGREWRGKGDGSNHSPMTMGFFSHSPMRRDFYNPWRRYQSTDPAGIIW